MSSATAPAVNANLRRRLLVLGLLALTLWASWKLSGDDPPATVTGRATPLAKRSVSKVAPAPAALPLEWPRRVDSVQPVTDLFGIPPPLPVGPPAALQAAPTVPTFKLKYVGRLDGSDSAHVFLADAQDQVISVKLGEALPEGWLLKAMDSKQLVFLHTASGQEQTMQIGTLP